MQEHLNLAISTTRSFLHGFVVWEVQDLSLNPQVALAGHHVFLQDTAWTFSFHFLAIDCSHLSAVLCISPHWTASCFFQAIPSLCWVWFDSNPGLQSSRIHSQLSTVCKFNKHILDSIIQAKTRNLLDKSFQLNSEALSSSLATLFQAVSY